MTERQTNDLDANSSTSLRGALSAWLSSGKTWWGVSLAIQIAASLGAAIAVLLGSVSSGWALALGVASVGGLLGRWRADFLRQTAEALLRHTEFEDGFGWQVSPKILADSMSRAVTVAKSAAARAREQASFYASTRPPGALRALDNLRESAWWTQQNAAWMGWASVWTVVILSLIAVWSLLVAATVIGAPTPVEVSRLLAAGISVVFAGNLLRLPFEYFRLASNASEADRKASELIRSNAPPSDAEAVRLLGDYQLARAMGPPIPDRLWRKRRDHLNEIWRRTRGAN